MQHEDAVFAVHPRAHDFMPVHEGRFGRRQVIGWTFRTFTSGLRSVGWVTCGGEVSRALEGGRTQAERNLRAYLKSQRQDAAKERS